jgi:hypothetical protein
MAIEVEAGRPSTVRVSLVNGDVLLGLGGQRSRRDRAS